MFKWFKKYFIPHEANDFKPHFLRGEITLAILGIVLVGELFFLGELLKSPAQFSYTASVLPSIIIEGTNQQRTANHESGLKENSVLDRAAQEKADDMASKGYFSHNSPDGKEPWFWFDKAGYNYSYAGENLAVNFFDSKDVVNAWMNSPKHKENILNNNFTEIGIGIAKGTYKGKEAIFVVQFFASPAKALTAVREADKPLVKIAPIKTINSIANNVVNSLAIQATTSQVLSAEIPPLVTTQKEVKKNRFQNFVADIISNPRQSLNYLYTVLFTIILFALALKVFIKINIQHPALIINASMMLIIIGSVMILHKYLSLYQGSIF